VTTVRRRCIGEKLISKPKTKRYSVASHTVVAIFIVVPEADSVRLMRRMRW